MHTFVFHMNVSLFVLVISGVVIQINGFGDADFISSAVINFGRDIPI